MKMPKNKFLKTLIYFLVVGGLLIVSSIIIFYIWNYLLVKFEFYPITYLEAIGINAILYVFVYSISYGFFGASSNLDFTTDTDDYIHNMTAKEKEELRSTLKKCLDDTKDKS